MAQVDCALTTHTKYFVSLDLEGIIWRSENFELLNGPKCTESNLSCSSGTSGASRLEKTRYDQKNRRTKV